MWFAKTKQEVSLYHKRHPTAKWGILKKEGIREAWQMVPLYPRVGHDGGLLVHWTVKEGSPALPGVGVRDATSRTP